MIRTASLVVFECHSKACAPPPVGHGGSTPGGSGSAPAGRSVKTLNDVTLESRARQEALRDSNTGAFNAVRNYLGEYYPEINGTMRGTIPSVHERPGDVELMRQGFDATAVPLPKPATLYRGMSVPTDWLEELVKPGTEFVDKAFVSTSTLKRVSTKFASDSARNRAEPIRLTIKAPKGTRAMAGTIRERELVLGPGTRFRVLGSKHVTVEHRGDKWSMLDVTVEVVP